MQKTPGASVFDTLREEIPIDRLIQPNGQRKASCVSPEHDDADPSMHVFDDHVHCFSCNFHGDIVDVWAATRGIGKPFDAALDLAKEFSVRLPETSQEGKQRAEARREQETTDGETARHHHEVLEREADASDRVRDWWEGRGFGPELRASLLLGANENGTEAIVPFWNRGRVRGLIRRKLEGEPKYRYPSAEEFFDGCRPLFIPGRLGERVFLAEGIIDAMAVSATGRSAIAVGGTNMSAAQATELQRALPKASQVYILPDDDEAGASAARTWARLLFPRGKICPASYGEGGKDIADAFARLGADEAGEHLDRLADVAQDLLDLETEAAAALDGGPREKLAFATEHLVPLLARVKPAGMQDATADIVADAVKGLKKSWLNRAIKDEEERLGGQAVMALIQDEIEVQERQARENQARVDKAQPEIDALLSPGVLGKLRDTAASMHNVYGDKEALELALLVALGAQLDPLPNGRPLGASILLTAGAGRGKNHLVDAAVKPLPEEFYFAFEIASGQSLYYKADEDPEFLKNTFAYPNEIEGAEALWEFLRPMLSKGSAKKIVTAKDAAGNMTTRTIIVEGPVTIAIPTIRNKTDEQLQTRLLVAELPDYPGRVKQHSGAVSEQLRPDANTADHSRGKFLWQAALRQLTAIRRVVFDLPHEDFALDDDQVSHGARLWANLLSLMATHAWLEQRNRKLRSLSEDVLAVEATPEDYAAAYVIFNKVCTRTMVNLSDAHRKILGALYDLRQEFPNREGFTQREIQREAKVSLSTISDNKTFLVTSAKFMKETEGGLCLVQGANPSWWTTGDIMRGLPQPAQVNTWWEDRAQAEEPTERVRHMFGNPPNAENGAVKPDRDKPGAVFGMFGDFAGSESIEKEDDPGLDL